MTAWDDRVHGQVDDLRKAQPGQYIVALISLPGQMNTHTGMRQQWVKDQIAEAIRRG